LAWNPPGDYIHNARPTREVNISHVALDERPVRSERCRIRIGRIVIGGRVSAQSGTGAAIPLDGEQVPEPSLMHGESQPTTASEEFDAGAALVSHDKNLPRISDRGLIHETPTSATCLIHLRLEKIA
jgi:hypothetical protein